MPLEIRQLNFDDWKAYRDLRLFGLRSDPGMFFAPYEREAGLPDEEWQRRVSDPSQAMFGLFAEVRLVGITGVVTQSDDPTGSTALLIASYILPEYRGQGHSAKFYEARLAWVRARPQYTRIVVSHRKSNEPSGRANRPFGFVETLRRPLTWPDGAVDDEVCYELRLSPVEAPMDSAYDKVIFTRDGDAPPPEHSGRTLAWRNAVDDPASFESAVRAVVSGSLDRHDAWTVANKGLDVAVASYCEIDETYFVRDPSRWESAWYGDTLVGLIQPVLYVDNQRDARPEGTLNYIGVLPSHRGRGYIGELLLRGTLSLYEQRVWRVFCDTDVNNFPMIAAFERMGYTRGRVRAIPLGD